MVRKIIFSALISMSALMFCPKCYAQNDDPPTEMAPPPKDGKHNGLQLDRANLLKNLIAKDTTLVFKEQSPTGKTPVLVAHGVNNSSVDVLGTENDLRKVTYKVFITKGNNASIKEAFNPLANLVATIVPQKVLLQWMMKKYISINSSPSLEIKEGYSIVGNQLIFIYEPSSASITLSIATEYN